MKEITETPARWRAQPGRNDAFHGASSDRENLRVAALNCKEKRAEMARMSLLYCEAKRIALIGISRGISDQSDILDGMFAAVWTLGNAYNLDLPALQRIEIAIEAARAARDAR
ncbi:MAG: hypothetical protein ACNA7O_14300 [Rhodobacterales bacterium]